MAPAATWEETRARRLRAALESLGPLFSCFGIYMSSRVDLLPATDCLELALIRDQMQATPIIAVRELFSREIGCPPEDAFLAFEPLPLVSRLIFQSHSAVLKSGEKAIVRVVHPGLEELLERDIGLIPILHGLFSSKEWGEIPIDDVTADFQRTLQQQLDFGHEVEAMKVLAEDAKQFDMLSVPLVHAGLSTSKVLTIEQSPGANLSDVVPYFDVGHRGAYAGARAPTGYAGIDPRDLARRLCVVWLRQAFLGGVFPVEPRLESIVLLPNNQIAFTRGVFSSLPAEAKANLCDYLMAALIEDPHKACAILLREMKEERNLGAENELEHRFREAVPFRDGGWSSDGSGDSIAERLFLHWRFAKDCGYEPRTHLVPFYRGLFLIANAARQLTRAGDSLSEAMEEVRAISLLSQLRNMMGANYIYNSLGRHAAMMAEIPTKFDEALTLAAEGGVRLNLQVTESAEQLKRKNSSAAGVALLLVLAAIVVLSRDFTALAPWGERVIALTLLLFGALLIRAVWSSY
jgi:predicted unusual protein kinase regulating ubiquinone biosynthesis (AarF/ABC1/UbiB family)